MYELISLCVMDQKEKGKDRQETQQTYFKKLTNHRTSFAHNQFFPDSVLCKQETTI